jgi:hypothetical protein
MPGWAVREQADDRSLANGGIGDRPGVGYHEQRLTDHLRVRPAGNRIKITPASGTETTLQYDQANRLTRYGSKASYTYNGDGLRMSKTVNSAATAFSWDKSGSLQLMLADGDDYYIYGADSQPLEKISGSSVTYLHRDQHGSTRFLTDSSGAVTGSLQKLVRIRTRLLNTTFIECCIEMCISATTWTRILCNKVFLRGFEQPLKL